MNPKISQSNLQVKTVWSAVSFIFFTSFLFPSPAAAALVAKSGPEKVSLLEVYSSEGCSSCPPAEEWVSRLAQDAGLWKKFVPVVFHVDYWDSLGWKDIFSDPRFAERQRSYAASWGTDSVYTPGFVLNGREWKDWYRTRSPEEASDKDSGELIIDKVDDHAFKITFTPAPQMKKTGYTAHAAFLIFQVDSEVKAGENAGRRLRHDFAVMDFAEKRMTVGTGDFEAAMVFSSLKPLENKKTAIVAWVTVKNQNEPLQTAGNYLSS